MVKLLNNGTAPLGLRAGASGYVEVAPKESIEITEKEAKHSFVQRLIGTKELVVISSSEKPSNSTNNNKNNPPKNVEVSKEIPIVQEQLKL